MPEAEQVFLDHAGLFVPDLAPVAGVLGRLGFTLTPPAPSGTDPWP